MDKPSGFHDRQLGVLGYILPRQYPLVKLQGTALHLIVTTVRVPTTAAVDVQIPTWENPGIALGPFGKPDPETEVVMSRHI
jgi:hypothetical protein